VLFGPQRWSATGMSDKSNRLSSKTPDDRASILSFPPPLTMPLPGFAPRRSCGSDIFPDCAWTEIGRSLRLTRRELQIVRGIFDDCTEFAIGAGLGISAHTVHTHMERLHRKLAVADRLELVLRIIHEFLRLTSSPGTELAPICANRSAGRCPLQSNRPVARGSFDRS
jgi:DNA-binding CsgD family transcriptional regulator